MRILAIILRVLIIVVGYKMMVLGNWDINTAPFISGVGFILVGIYFAIQSVAGPKAMLCPLFHGFKTGGCKNK